MGKRTYMKRVTVPLGDLYDKIKADAAAQGKSLNEYVQGAIAAFANGEIVQTSKLFTGEPSTACVYALEACNACPLRKAYPELQKPENALALLKFCNGCHIKKLAIELEKAKIKARCRMNAQQQTTTTAPAVPKPEAAPRRTFDCINGCGVKLYWPAAPTKDNPKCRPLEADTSTVHFCPLYKPKPKTDSQQVAAMVMGRVVCSVCKQGFSADSYRELERDFFSHTDEEKRLVTRARPTNYAGHRRFWAMTERTLQAIEDRLAIYKSTKAANDKDDEIEPITPQIFGRISGRYAILRELRKELKADLKHLIFCVAPSRVGFAVGTDHKLIDSIIEAL